MDPTEKTLLGCFLSLLAVGAIILGVIFSLNRKPQPKPTTISKNSTAMTVEVTPQPNETPLPNKPPTTSPSPTNLNPAEANLESLENPGVPDADWVKLAEEFRGLKNIPYQLNTQPQTYSIGDKTSFWVLDTDTNENRAINATLEYQDGRIYFWVENGVSFDPQALRDTAETFSNKIYPTDHAFFGQEWIPGVDNDAHLYILYARKLGEGVAGYTSDMDSYLKAADPYSNQHEMFYINADLQNLSDPYTLGVMAHEFQHLIQMHQDPHEELWLNEGFSELAMYINHYTPSGFDRQFAADPDINLTNWTQDSGIHYGSSFLFTDYMLDRLGKEATMAAADNPAHGLKSLDIVFADENIHEYETGAVLTADQFFQDWTLTNYLENPNIGDGIYAYHNYNPPPLFESSQSVVDCSSDSFSTYVNQYGTDYLKLTCSHPVKITFLGKTTTKILSVFPASGNYYAWGNDSDLGDAKMTREFDFTKITGKISLSYEVWYDLEQDYDFAYLLASEDGSNWTMLNPPSCTRANLAGMNFGCGYNGSSGGWIKETVDLSRYAGKKVSLRFEYVTDAGITGEGIVVDDIEIPQINYHTGFESGNGGWNLEGFARISNAVPQSFLVSIIENSGSKVSVQKYQVTSGQSFSFDLPSETNMETILAISGSSRVTRQLAKYSILFGK